VELVARSLVKRYPGVTALDDVGIALRGGEVHAIAGENGAGKSTLMGVLSGAVQPDAGSIEVDGEDVRFESPHGAQLRGIRMIHQELNLVPELSVAENIFLGSEPARRGVVDRTRQQQGALAVLNRLGQSAIDPRARVADLPLAARQMTEIAKAVARDAALLIMDEPTAILAHEETEALFAVIEQLRAAGVAIAYISHRLDEIFRIAGRVTVLRDGRVVSTDPIDALTREDVVRRMVGRDLAGGYPAGTGAAGDVILSLDRVSAGPVRDITLSLRRGEILGLVGLVGAGRTEVAQAIHGHLPITAGTMTLGGAPYHPRTPHDAIAAGIGLLPEDRKGQGLILMAAIRENASLASLGALARRGVVDRSRESTAVRHWADVLSLRTPSFERPARLLSGGNQQKVVLARWLIARSRVLLFDEPTRGIDVGAKAEIYALMRKLADEGTAILMISSDLPEALGMADRVLVMRGGRIVGELSAAEATQERALRLILGESAAA
jgi:ABC-type sugar transport system ATPase subunit